jgi:hypothetical protein
MNATVTDGPCQAVSHSLRDSHCVPDCQWFLPPGMHWQGTVQGRPLGPSSDGAGEAVGAPPVFGRRWLALITLPARRPMALEWRRINPSAACGTVTRKIPALRVRVHALRASIPYCTPPIARAVRCSATWRCGFSRPRAPRRHARRLHPSSRAPLFRRRAASRRGSQLTSRGAPCGSLAAPP